MKIYLVLEEQEDWDYTEELGSFSTLSWRPLKAYSREEDAKEAVAADYHKKIEEIELLRLVPCSDWRRRTVGFGKNARPTGSALQS